MNRKGIMFILVVVLFVFVAQGIADAGQNKIYWTDSHFDKIQCANLDGSGGVQDILTKDDGLGDPTGASSHGPIGIALDVAGGKIYWTHNETDKIQRANLDGNNVEDLVTGLYVPGGIALDVVGDKMYWVNHFQKKIQCTNLDGSDDVQDLVKLSTAFTNLMDIALDVAGGKMYWTDYGNDKIQCANLDGSGGVQDILTKDDGLYNPRGIALDVARGKIYWTEVERGKLRCANLNGSKKVQDLVTRGNGFGTPIDVALDVARGKIYWAEENAQAPGKIRRAKLNGSNIEDVEDLAILPRLSAPANIALGFGIPDNSDPDPSVLSPDLVVESPSASKTTLSPGESFTLSVRIVNRGTADSPSTTLRYYRSVNKATATRQTQFYSAVVGPKRPISGNVFSGTPLNLEAPDTPGTYYYSICIDPVENESNTDNNCITPIRITVKQPVVQKPDLVVESPRVSKGTLSPGERFTLSAKVKNRGSGQANSTTLRYYRSSNRDISTGDTRVGTPDSVSALGPNRTSDESVDLNAPTAPGTYYYGACVDKVANESNTTNNCSTAVEITVKQGPDLVVKSPRVSKSILLPGERFTLSVTVANKGTAESPATTLRYYRQFYTLGSTIDTQVDTDTVNGLGLPTGGRSTSDKSIMFTAPTTPGTYYYRACVESVVNESDEGNNCSTDVQITVRLSAVVSPLQLSIYWTEFSSQQIRRVSLDSTNVEDIITTGLSRPTDIALDVSGGKIYWTSYGEIIRRANLDGTNVEDIVTDVKKGGAVFGLYGIALDVSDSKMYWINGWTGQIRRANLDGTNVEDFATGLGKPKDIALDVSGRKIYWSNPDSRKIRRANLDGTNVEDIVTGLHSPGDIALDVSGRKIYWSNPDSRKIRRANLDGTNVEDIITGLWTLRDIALDVSGSKIYWIISIDKKIQRANLDGTNVEDIVTGLHGPQGIALGIPSGTPPSNRKPDLVVEPPSVSKSTLSPGESFRLSVTVANRGTAESGSTTLRYYRSSDPKISTSDTQVDTDTVNGLGLPTGGRSTSDESVTLTAPTTPGIYYYGACVDRVGNEGTTNNNCSTAVKITVEPPADDHGDTLADATLISVGIVRPGVVDRSRLVQGVIGTPNDIDYFRVEVTGAGKLTVYTTGSLDTVGKLQNRAGNRVANDDNAGTGRNFRIQRVVNSNTYYVKVQGRGGNTGSYTLHVEIALDDPNSTADLIAQGTWVSNKTLAPGASFKLGVAVMNVGDALSPATTLKYYRSSNDKISTSDVEVGTDAVKRISADGKSEEQITLTAPDTLGTYFYGACVESVKNEGTTNNNCSPAVKVTVEPPDDYGDTRAEATRLPLNSSLNGVIETGADIDYFRVEVSEPGNLAVWTTGSLNTIGRLQENSGTVLASDDDSGSGKNFSMELANPVTAGTYYIKVESYLSNTGDYTIHASFVQQPDLAIESAWAEPSTVAPGDKFKLYSILKNQGTAQSAATILRYYRSDDDTIDETSATSDTQIGTGKRDPLSADGTIRGRFTVTAPNTPGTYYYGVCVDHVENESDTGNNCSEVVSITVSLQTNAVVRVTPDSLTQGAGEPVTFKIDITDAKDVIGYDFTLAFDPSVLEYLSSRNGNYFAGVEGKHIAIPEAKLTTNSVTLGALNIQDYESSGAGTLAYVTFKVRQQGTSTLALSEVKLTRKGGAVVYPRVEQGQIIGTVLPPQQNIVKLIYFLPSDRVAQEKIDEKIDTLIRGAQQFFAEQMEQKNVHVKKTFTFETDAAGKAVVHLLKGTLTDDEYYQGSYHKISDEVAAKFDTSKNLFLIAADLKGERLGNPEGAVCGLGGRYSTYDADRWITSIDRVGGVALIPASGDCFENPNVTYHELGHAFGLDHDFRSYTYIMSYGNRPHQLSNCATEWLDASRFFNSNQSLVDKEVSTIERLPQLADRPEVIKFKITDADGLHQVQLTAAPIDGEPPPGYHPSAEENWRKEKWRKFNLINKQFLHTCKRLNGESETVEFDLSKLRLYQNTDEIWIQVIDKYGNIVGRAFEPRLNNHGDTAADATPLSLPGSIVGEITTGDGIDYFRVVVDVPGTLIVYTTGSLDTEGELQDSSNATLVYDDDSGNNYNFRIKHTVNAGTYYIKVGSYDVNTGVYTVHVSFSPDDVPADVNGDGVVDESDLVIVTANLGTANATHAQGDVNGDGEVNLSDVIAVLEVLEGAAAPTANSRERSTFTIETLQEWIDRAKQLNIRDADFQKGIAVLEELLKTLIETEKVPAQTALLANYPNPFNPETWIPYQLAKPADVTLTIYDIKGHVVRALDLGHQRAGIYRSRSRAAYWDGRNTQGEPVASGVYFYRLKTRDFSATRKMLIRK